MDEKKIREVAKHLSKNATYLCCVAFAALIFWGEVYVFTGLEIPYLPLLLLALTAGEFRSTFLGDS